MIRLALWLVLCLALAYLSRRRPVVVVSAGVALWVALPAVAGELVTGVGSGPLRIHPASWLLLVGLAVQVVTRPGPVLAAVARRIFLVIALALVVAVGLVTTVLTGSGGVAILVDMVVAPVALFGLVTVTLDEDPRQLGTLRTTLLTLAAAESVLTIVQWAAGRALVFEEQQATRWWFVRPGFDRWSGTTDHPLTLALMLCLAVPLLAGLQRVSIQLGGIALMAAAVGVTQSRSGIVIIALGALIVVSRSRLRTDAKVLLYLALGGAGAALAASSVTAGLQQRFANDTGSTQARVDALEFFGRIWADYAVTGGGFTSSYRVAAVGGLETSLESSFLMYAVDIGLLFAVLYFGVQLVILLRSIGQRAVPGLTAAALVAVAVPQTSSALASASAAGVLVWLVLGMADSARAPVHRALSDEDRQYYLAAVHH